MFIREEGIFEEGGRSKEEGEMYIREKISRKDFRGMWKVECGMRNDHARGDYKKRDIG